MEGDDLFEIEGSNGNDVGDFFNKFPLECKRFYKVMQHRPTHEES
jgi:hypothetical protein